VKCKNPVFKKDKELNILTYQTDF